jgi:hypothetical protein
MEERRSIFSARGDGEKIGYIEGAEAFNLSGRRRCRYDEQTGNLRDLAGGKIVGHVSLEGRFIGLSWLADELFRKSDSDIDPPTLQEEGPLDGAREQVPNEEPTRRHGGRPNDPESHISSLDDMSGDFVQEENTPNGVVERIKPARTGDESPRRSGGAHLRPLRQVLAAASELFGQSASEEDRDIDGMLDSLVERVNPAVPGEAAAGRSVGFPEEAELIFERLRERIGLDQLGLVDFEKTSSEPADTPTSSAREKSGYFP